MKKIYFILAVAATFTFSSCMNDEFIGGNTGTDTPAEEAAIVFGSNAGKLTRATQNTGNVAEMLDGHFGVYGVKNVGTAWSDVFQNYIVWSSTGKTPTNPDAAEGVQNGWEYVGPSTQTYGQSSATIGKNQYAKYWDYSASNHHFVAGSPAGNFTFKLNDTTKDIASADVTGIAGHITANPTGGSGTAISTSPVYIADPVNVDKGHYKQEVTFNFTRQQTFVRVGVFETIPGYKITKINFYEYDTNGWKTSAESTQNIILASTTADYFSGATNATVTINYNWTGATPTYTYSYSAGLTTAKNWYGGLLNGVEATSSTETNVAKMYGTDKDMATNGYFTVIPTASSVGAQPILVKCDYELTSEDNVDVINVKGATAAIPAAFTFWKPNTTYTYLFKISDNTNGTTGTPGTTDPEGLFPISFDAVVTAEADGTAQGTITSVSTPSITTYQKGSVTTEGVKYVKNKAINFTAQNDETGALNSLTALDNASPAVGMVQVYSLGTEAKTEADMILTRPTTTATTTIGAATWNSIDNGKWASFTPTAAGYYAIEYITATSPSVAYTYKIVYVAE